MEMEKVVKRTRFAVDRMVILNEDGKVFRYNPWSASFEHKVYKTADNKYMAAKGATKIAKFARRHLGRCLKNVLIKVISDILATKHKEFLTLCSYRFCELCGELEVLEPFVETSKLQEFLRETFDKICSLNKSEDTYEQLKSIMAIIVFEAMTNFCDSQGIKDTLAILSPLYNKR